MLEVCVAQTTLRNGFLIYMGNASLTANHGGLSLMPHSVGLPVGFSLSLPLRGNCAWALWFLTSFLPLQGPSFQGVIGPGFSG